MYPLSLASHTLRRGKGVACGSFHRGTRDRPPGRMMTEDANECIGHRACKRQELRVLLDR